MTRDDLDESERTPEAIVASFVRDGILHVAEDGTVWRLRRKVGGNQGPRLMAVRPERADREMPSGRTQVQVWVEGVRYVCFSYRLVWFLANGPIPEKHHIHHINGDPTDNRLENLECVEGKSHIAKHSRERYENGYRIAQTSADLEAARESRRRNQSAKCAYTYRLWRDGRTQGQVAKDLGITLRQVSDRLRAYRTASAA
jgi:hypothetical protein